MRYAHSFPIGLHNIGADHPTYFIADIGANHDCSLTKALMLIEMAAHAGADCVKFQHFRAKDIVSAKGFENLKTAHQTGWEKSVFETYEDYSINRSWDPILAAKAKECGVHFMTTPYDTGAIDGVDPYVPAYKIGSGDITYHQLISAVARRDKPVFLATGASSLQETIDAVHIVLRHNPNLCVMQCNTNYTGDPDNIGHVNLRVLSLFASLWPGMPLGLSDHTPGALTALGAVALGARVIEKHFTLDRSSKGPDHAFAMDYDDWRRMVKEVRLLERALGDGIKRIEANEVGTAVVQRRAMRAKRHLSSPRRFDANDFEALRPCPCGAVSPNMINEFLGKRIENDIAEGQELYPHDLA